MQTETRRLGMQNLNSQVLKMFVLKAARQCEEVQVMGGSCKKRFLRRFPSYIFGLRNIKLCEVLV